MKRVGMVVAVEIDAVDRIYGMPLDESVVCGIPFRHYRIGDIDLYLGHCGMGEIASSATTAILITHFGVEEILNFGVVGALSEKMERKDVVIAKEVFHYEMDVSQIDPVVVGQHEGYPSPILELNGALINKASSLHPEIPLVRVASGNLFITGEGKRKYSDEYGCDICEMELAGIAYAASPAGIPVFSIKAVADSFTGGAEEYYDEKEHAAEKCLRVLDELLRS